MTDLYRLAIRKDQAAADALAALLDFRYDLKAQRSSKDAAWDRFDAAATAYVIAYDAYRKALDNE